MGSRTLLLLVVLALGLGAVLWFTDEQKKPNQVDALAVLQGRSLNECTRMRWQWKGRVPIEIARGSNGVFEMKEPLVDMASVGHMKQILVAWDSAQMRATQLADDASGRRQAGLDPAEFTFRADFPDQQAIAVEIGGPGPLGDTRFLRAHGKIWEVGNGLIESMRGNTDDFRERAVFRNVFGQVTEVRVAMPVAGGKRETIHVQRAGDGWRLLAPVQGRADPVETQRFVTSVVGLRVDNFVSGVVKPREDKPSLDLTVKGSFGEEHLELWDERREMFGRLPGRDVWFNSGNLQYAEIFENAVERMRARILVPMGESAFSELIELVVDPGAGRGDRVRLSRANNSEPWALVEPVAATTAPTPCQDAVQAVQTLVAVRFDDTEGTQHPRAEDPRYGLRAVDGRIALSLRGVRDQHATTLWLGKDVQLGTDAFVYCCRADEPDTVVLVQKAQVDTLRRPWTDYCALLAMKVDAVVERLEVDGVAPARAYQIENDKWVRAGSPEPQPDVGDFVENELRDLRGTKAVDARGAAFEQPTWTLRLMRRNRDELAALRVFDRGDGQPLRVQRVTPERGTVAYEVRPGVEKLLRALAK